MTLQSFRQTLYTITQNAQALQIIISSHCKKEKLSSKKAVLHENTPAVLAATMQPNFTA